MCVCVCVWSGVRINIYIYIYTHMDTGRDEVAGEWRRLHNKELNDLYCSSNIVQVIKSRRMRWAGQVARIVEVSGVYRVTQ